MFARMTKEEIALSLNPNWNDLNTKEQSNAMILWGTFARRDSGSEMRGEIVWCDPTTPFYYVIEPMYQDGFMTEMRMKDWEWKLCINMDTSDPRVALYMAVWDRLQKDCAEYGYIDEENENE